MRIVNRDSDRFTTDLEPFRGTNLSGVKVGKMYIVYSYGWYPIYLHLSNQWYRNSNKYSPTTSTHSTHSCPNSDDILPLTHDEIKALIEGNRKLQSA